MQRSQVLNDVQKFTKYTPLIGSQQGFLTWETPAFLVSSIVKMLRSIKLTKPKIKFIYSHFYSK